MLKSSLLPGLRGSAVIRVGKEHMASTVGSGNVEVFATPMLIAGMEEAAVAAVANCLDKGETTVGVHVDVAHNAATPLDMTVRFHARLEEVSHEGKTLTFRVEAFDEAGKIGEGLHKRVIVNKDSFEKMAGSRMAATR